jgi:adenylate cyclase
LAYKSRPLNIPDVASALGVRYVLEGSIRRIDDKIRISAQLIDASQDTHVWAKQYDEPVSSVFDVQDDLTREIAGSLLVNIRMADLDRTLQKRPSDLSAYDYVLRARALWDTPGKEAKLKARELAENAIALDPNYAPAYAVLGDTYNSAYILQWEGPEALDKAYELARKAVELDPQSSQSYELLGRVFLRKNMHSEAILLLNKAIELNPNRSFHYAALADVLTFANRPEEAIELMQKAIRLDPFYPARDNMYLGRAYYFSNRYEEAMVELRTCVVRTPRYRPCYMYLAPTYAELDRQEDAANAVGELMRLSPDFSIYNSVLGHLPFVEPAMEFYVAGLRKAGVPD